MNNRDEIIKNDKIYMINYNDYINKNKNNTNIK